MNRRGFLTGALGVLATAAGGGGTIDAIWQGLVGRAHAAGGEAPFSRTWLLGEAGRLAAQPFEYRKVKLPKELKDLTYDQYRDIRFRPEAAIWRDANVPFRVDLFHTGFYFKTPVEIALVEAGVAHRVYFSPDMFDYGPSITPPPAGTNIPFSGFRVRHPINRSDVWDEFAVFQGASYFRAVGKNELYGLSARGLALKTAEPEGEEFPAFSHFWIERPEPGATALVVHALLDSPSTTGAYRFSIRPGEATLIDVELALFPRVDLKAVGLAPLTSMFLFDATNRHRFDDFRPAVYDSDGLQMHTGSGEWLWRPLANPVELQISAFIDRAPRGFGLVQRNRAFANFQDLEARYERRPSVWVETIGDWGEGLVELVEIPSDRETNDNVVTFWRPAQPIAKGGPWTLAYRLRWGDGFAVGRPSAIVIASRMGKSFDGKRRLFVIDFIGGPATADGLSVEASASAGTLSNVVVQANPETGGLRASFELDPGDARLSELRLRILQDATAVGETWLYRWTAT